MGDALRRSLIGIFILGLAVGAGAQTVTAVSVPGVPLLPGSFGEWKQHPGDGAAPAYSLSKVNKDALEECGPQRSAVADYGRGGKTLHIEAIQFGDRTGALSAFTLVERAGMREGKELGELNAVGDVATLFMQGSSLVLVNGTADVASLKPLADGLPKVFGSKAVAPILPTILPVKGLVSGSLRYALGPVTYKAEGGVLPANSVGWDKSAEAVTAQYDDARGKETLTVLMYPTPTIAGEHAKAVKELIGDAGASKVRRDGVVVALATGSFAAADAQKLVESVHLKEDVATDKELALTPHEKAMQGYSLLKSITILALVLMGSAVLLGLFLGGGRAAIRVLRGKPAAVEVEFLSLHLSPQNKPAQFGGQERGNSG